MTGTQLAIIIMIVLPMVLLYWVALFGLIYHLIKEFKE